MRRTIVGIRDVQTGRRSHVERVVPILDREHDAVERADQLAGRLEVGVLLRGHFERVGHVGIAVRSIGHAPRLSCVEPLRRPGGRPEIQGNEGIELAGVLDGRERPENALGLIDARPVIGLDPVQIKLDDSRRGQTTLQDFRLDALDRRLLDLELRRLWRGEQRCRHHQGDRAAHADGESRQAGPGHEECLHCAL